MSIQSIYDNIINHNSEINFKQILAYDVVSYAVIYCHT